jgi:arylsulfatase A
VIIVLIDDIGYEAIGAYGCTSYKTPVIDKLAAGGVRFGHCYVQPLCTPTRSQLMTGLYNVRNYTNFGNMDPKAVTFANLFKKAGYATCMAGKWQLGHNLEQPKDYGFDEYCLWQHMRRPPRYANPGLEINGVQKDFKNGEYGPDLVSDYALDFVKRKKDGPFLLYYTSLLTHPPFQPTPDSKDWDPKAMGEGVNHSPAHFKDNVEYTDKLMGKLMATLEEAGVRERTLVIFLGDNGTAAGTKSQVGEKVVIGGKGKMTDSGMHVPLIVSWPGKIEAGRVCDDIVDSTDFFPTICEAAGITIPAEMKLDGRSFWPQLMGQKGNPREWYYCWFAPWGDFVGEFAATDQYKLYRTGKFYDLTKDLDERKPLAVKDLRGEAAGEAKKLQGALDQYKDARPAEVEKATVKGKKGKEE